MARKPIYARYPGLKNVPVIVSGGASGIGEAIVRAYATEGARVGFVDIAEKDGTALAAKLGRTGATVRFIRCDVTDTDAYRAAIQAFAKAHGACRVLLNNAAHDQRHDWREVTPDYWDNRIAVNLKHSFFAIQAVAPGMIKAGGGSIVNFGSISWMINTGNMPAYTASKAAMHGLSRSLGRDLGKHNIRVNTLVPGWVMTQRQIDLWIDDAANALIDASQTLAGRVMPEDIARTALFLGSDDSRMISGQDFIVDGGWA
ncbi:MAG: SDR family oxidoreductase [Rhizobiaceae bacterium]|nr:SDR family oxidoreductase [Rhizobiaceae bacterium]